jgi:hypothetical protein
VELPPGLLPPKAGVGQVTGVIVADAVRQVDYRERGTAFVVSVPRGIVEDVLDKLLAVLEGDWSGSRDACALIRVASRGWGRFGDPVILSRHPRSYSKKRFNFKKCFS